MKISLEWLGEYLPGPLDAQRCADLLTNAGLPVENIETLEADTILDVEVTSNRGDCLSHLGIARELGALLDRRWNDPKFDDAPLRQAGNVEIEASDLCPHYIAVIIRNIRVGASPAWLARRLRAVGLPVINNVVDVTNYVMFEMGQPLHTFDLDKLAEGRIIVRTARADEKLESIDGKERVLDPSMLVIADAHKPAAIAGVMGGKLSEISDRTVNVLLESARFDPLSVRKTSRALSLKSDSSYRFERQIDPTLPQRAAFRASQLIAQLTGGQIIGQASAGSGQTAPRRLSLRMENLTKLLGVSFPIDEVAGALNRPGFSPKPAGDRIETTVPSWRLDVSIEADLIEEAARIIGYSRIPIRDEISIRVAPLQPELKTTALVRNFLVAAGYFEAITVTFVSDPLAGDFLPREAASLPRAGAMTRQANAHLRPSLIPGLLEALRHNESVGNENVALFEAGSAFWCDAAGEIVETSKLALVSAGGVAELRGVVESLLAKLDATKECRMVLEDAAGYERAISCRIEWDGNAIGHIGMVSSKTIDKVGLRQKAACAELDLAALLAGTQPTPKLHALPRFPAVQRDVSLVLKESTRYESIENIVAKLKLPDLEKAEHVITYRGKPLDKDAKSVTVTLIFRAADRTLVSADVDGAVERFVNAAKNELDAAVRT